MPMIHWNDGYVGGNRPKKDGFLEELVSYKEPVTNELRSTAERVGEKARANLEESGRSGRDRTSIRVKHPPQKRQGRFGTYSTVLDSSVHLVSKGGLWGAMAIEFGRESTPYNDWFRDHGGQEGKFILSRAAGLKGG